MRSTELDDAFAKGDRRLAGAFFAAAPYPIVRDAVPTDMLHASERATDIPSIGETA
jgi:hypothetical protein